MKRSSNRRRLARIILHTASQFPTDDPVNLDFIGHSEGTVVNTYAIVKLESSMTPNLKAGFIVDTLLDPHAANNNLPGQQISFAGTLAGLARTIVTNYQASANDPPAFVPSIVDEAQVFFEHTAGHCRWHLQPLGTGSRQERGSGRALLQPDGHGSDALG